MVHVSQLATRRVEKPEDVVHEGDEIMVKVTEIDDKGRINLSRKGLAPGEEINGGKRGFEIVSTWKDAGISLPRRKTAMSAGYDIESAVETEVLPGEIR